jgi:hypothetical protein
MKIDIDVSIFTRGGSFGHAIATIELAMIPNVGDTLSFIFPKDSVGPRPSGFSGMLKVSARIVDAAGRPNILLTLEDLILETPAEAAAVAKYLERGFGIVVDIH